MIAKITCGSDSAGCCRYDLDHDQARILAHDGLAVDPLLADRLAQSNGATRKTLARKLACGISHSFDLQAAMNDRVSKPVHHIAISFKKEDEGKLSDELMVRIAQDYLERMGWGNTQYMVTRHCKDGGNPHFHILLNAVDNDGRKIDTNNERVRNMAVCREMKMEYGLTFAPDKSQTQIAALHGSEKVRYKVYQAARNALDKSEDYDSFRRNLASQGVRLEEVKNNAGRIQGLKYSTWDKEQGQYFSFNGSKLGRDMSYLGVMKHFGEDVGFGQEAGLAEGGSHSHGDKYSLAGTILDAALSGMDAGYSQTQQGYYEDDYLKKKKKKGQRL